MLIDRYEMEGESTSIFLLFLFALLFLPFLSCNESTKKKMSKKSWIDAFSGELWKCAFHREQEGFLCFHSLLRSFQPSFYSCWLLPSHRHWLGNIFSFDSKHGEGRIGYKIWCYIRSIRRRYHLFSQEKSCNFSVSESRNPWRVEMKRIRENHVLEVRERNRFFYPFESFTRKFLPLPPSLTLFSFFHFVSLPPSLSLSGTITTTTLNVYCPIQRSFSLNPVSSSPLSLPSLFSDSLSLSLWLELRLFL